MQPDGRTLTEATATVMAHLELWALQLLLGVWDAWDWVRDRI